MRRLLGRGAAALVCVVSLVGTAASARAVTGATDPSARKTAKLAVATAADLGTGWTQYRKASGVQPAGKSNCSIKSGSPLKASDKFYAGPTYEDATKTMFAYSAAAVFRSAADAKAYTAILNTPSYQNCKVAQDDAAQKKRDPKTFVKLNETTNAAIGGSSGLEAYYSENQGGKDATGADAPAAEYFRYTYRHGPVVYVIYVDTALPTDQASSTALGQRIADAVNGMNAAIDGRLTAAGV